MPRNVWEVYAVRYAHHERAARENFMAGDPHDDSPMPLDYYVWTLRSNGRIFVIDTGFDERIARQRGRTFLKSPGEGLNALGIDPGRLWKGAWRRFAEDMLDCCLPVARSPSTRKVLSERSLSGGSNECSRPEAVVAWLRRRLRG